MLCKLAEAAGVGDVLFIITQAGPSSRRFFKSLLDLFERAEEDAAAFDLLQGMMRGPVSASWLSGEFERYLGRSPFPKSLTSDPTLPTVNKRSPEPRKPITYRSMGYVSMPENLDANLFLANTHLAQGNLPEGGAALVSLATKLWRLYEPGYDLLTRRHGELIRRLLALLPAVPREYQRKAFEKLEPFNMSYSGSDFSRQKLLPFPIKHLEADFHPGAYVSLGNDPQFILFGESLVLPRGQFHMSFRAYVFDGNLRDPRIYYDLGSGFSETNSILVAPGLLRDCNVQLQLPNGVTRLRLDPGSEPGRFWLGEIVFETVLPAITHNDFSRAVADFG